MSEIILQEGTATESAMNHKTSPTSKLSEELEKFRKWREAFKKAITQYQDWVEKNEPLDGERDLRVYQLIESLASDELRIAFVGEFSRGKTELLNSIFFSDHGQRLLPSSAGRTTMCPTELRYNEKEGPCIKLLPIETRKTDISISEYKKSPIHWSTIHLLKRDSEDEIDSTLNEITKTKRVHTREAEDLGLFDSQDPDNSALEVENDMVDVPIWRYAIVNYPHPFLEQGVVILDTPGLNALGAEPELTLSILPDAHAVVFLLAADAGVTASDMSIWKNHVVSAKKDRRNERIVVLNKIDALWDSLRDDAAIGDTVRKQVLDTAQTLQLNKDVVLPVSAKMALTGKIKGDSALVAKSGIAALEMHLARQLIPSKYEIIRRKITYEISNRVEGSQALLKARLAEVDQQLVRMRDAGTKNKTEIQQLIQTLREEKEKYDREVVGFENTRKLLGEKAQQLFQNLDMGSLDKRIKTTRRTMHESWTTGGLKSSIKDFFDAVTEPMDKIKQQSDAIKTDIDKICLRLNSEYGMEKVVPQRLALLPYVMEIKRLEEKAMAFRTSTELLVTEQGSVVSKFFITLVSEVRNIYKECNQYSQGWFHNIANQVHSQIQLHKKSIDTGFETIKKSHTDMDSIADQVTKLSKERKAIAAQLSDVNKLHAQLHKAD
ncbi:MAG: dynamin family protein [Proteobacteria bacterium]|nr:dynamin family protein [Pseudomonadota bacterium]